MKKFLTVFFLIFGLFGTFIFVFAQTGGNSKEINQLNDAIAQKKEKIKQIEQSIDGYKSKIKQKQLEAKSLTNQMSILDNYIAKVELDIQATEEKLSSLNLQIESLVLSIKDKEKAIVKQKEILSELIRTIYERDNKTYLEIAATYDNFSDFYNQVYYLNTIEKDLGKSVRGLKDIKNELADKKQQTEERKKSYEDLKNTLVQKKMDLAEQTEVKQDLLAKTQGQEMQYNTLLANLKTKYQQIEGEIEGIEQEVRKKLEANKKLEKIEQQGATVFSWPTQSRYITTTFYDPDYPYRNVFEHTGIDIRSAQGTPVKAAGSGYIARAKRCTLASCYSYVMIIHADGLATVYGHLSGISVGEDQFVTRGDIIGYSGGTRGTVGAGPFVTGPHLHFEVRMNGIPVNPMNYLPS